MVVKALNNILDDILFVVVTCSRDRWRDKATKKLILSLNKENTKLNFSENIVFFDNSSKYLNAFSYLKFKPKVVVSEKNMGYWSALKWSLENAPKIFGRTFKYIHPIESDLVLFDMHKLAIAKEFLEKTPGIKCVRTQEFRVDQKVRYFKNSKTIFKKKRSCVADYNGVTDEKVHFKRSANFPEVYISNWHAKVPALHDYKNLSEILKRMQEREDITEELFMTLCYEKNTEIGVLDGGVYYTTSYQASRWKISGSYTPESTLKKFGYLATREGTTMTECGHVKVYNEWPRTDEKSLSFMLRGK